MLRAAAAALVLLAPLAAAFSALPPGDSPHDLITREAAAANGFPQAAQEALADAVAKVDVEEIQPGEEDGKATFKADDDYRPAHHCDRGPGFTDAMAFAAASGHFQEARLEPKTLLSDGRPKEAMRSLGLALHVLQDCFAHSNAVDLGPEAARRMAAALAGNGTPPPGLRLTGYTPGLEREGEPPGDPYPHDLFAKDDADGNNESLLKLPDGRTKHDAARQLATEASTAFLAETLAGLTEGERAALLAVEPTRGGLPLPAPLAVPVLFLAAALARRRA